MNFPIHTRKQALEIGLSKYWVGRMCRNGHESLRYSVSGMCIACINAARRRLAMQLNTAKVARRGGLVPVTVLAPPDNVDDVKAYAAALAAVLGLTG